MLSGSSSALPSVSAQDFFRAWTVPLLLTGVDGTVHGTNPAFLRWAEGLGLEVPVGLSSFLESGRGQPGDTLHLWDQLRAGRSVRLLRRFPVPDRDEEWAAVELALSPLPSGPWGGALLVIQIHDLNPALVALEDASERERTRLMLDLLGSTLDELESPAESLRWLADLGDGELESLPRTWQEPLGIARRGARRIVEMFHEVRMGPARAGLAPQAGEDGMIRLLLPGGEPAAAARLLDGLRSQGLHCLMRVVHDPETVYSLARAREADVLLLPAGTRPDPEGDLPERILEGLREESLDLPVFLLERGGDAVLARSIREAVRRRRREDAAGTAWRRIEELALRDPLTGRLNRRAFDRYACVELSRARRYGFPVGLAVFDLDRFKEVNDRLGHAFGDRALSTFAAVLAAGARDTDLVARFGGDEFMMLLPHTDLAGGRILIERLRERATEALAQLLDGRLDPLPGVSAGLAVYPGEGEGSLATLFAAADAALLEAKRAGRGRVAAAGNA